jgi:hypothetical protein
MSNLLCRCSRSSASNVSAQARRTSTRSPAKPHPVARVEQQTTRVIQFSERNAYEGYPLIRRLPRTRLYRRPVAVAGTADLAPGRRAAGRNHVARVAGWRPALPRTRSARMFLLGGLVWTNQQIPANVDAWMYYRRAAPSREASESGAAQVNQRQHR